MKEMKTKFLPILFAATALLFGCEDSQNGSNPIDPSITAPVSMTVEWNDIYPGDSAPDGYVMLVGPYEYDFSRNTFDSIFPAGNDQEFIVYNEPLGIVFTNGIATLAEATRVAVNPERQPDNLYYGKGVYSLVEGEHADITIPTKRGTAPLTVRIAYDKTLAPSLSSEITASLSGVAATRNLHTGELSDEVVFHSTVTLDNSEDQFELNFNIFGVIGERQVVTLVVSDVNGNPTNISYDITSELQDFNTAMEPTVVDATLNIPTIPPVDIDWQLADVKLDNYPSGTDWVINSPENPTLEELKGLKVVLSQILEFSSIDLTLTGIKVIPDGISEFSTGYYDGALSRCDALKSISMPEATTIGISGFNGCRGLLTIDFPNVTEINNSAFENCQTLTALDFPEASFVGRYAFKNCTSLESITLGKATNILSHIFQYSYVLTTVHIGTGLTSAPSADDINIESEAFGFSSYSYINLTVGYGTASGTSPRMTWTPETGSSFAGFNSVVVETKY